MKIHKIQVQNVKSFERVELTFNEDFNIFIGANGSGKSNMLDILTICLKAFFIYSYEEKIVSGRTNITWNQV